MAITVASGDSGSRRRRSTDTPTDAANSFISTFSAPQFQAAVAATVGSSSVTANEVDVLSVNLTSTPGQVIVTFAVAISSSSAGYVQSALATPSLFRNMLINMGADLMTDVVLTGTRTWPLTYTGIAYNNPIASAIFRQVKQLYQLQDALTALQLNISNAASTLETALVQVESRFLVGAIGAPGATGPNNNMMGYPGPQVHYIHTKKS